MQKLEKQFNARENTYVQLDEGENHYLYGVYLLKSKPDGEPSYYEVFRKNVRKEETSPIGKRYPEREVYPGDNAFGNWAWCCSSLERVEFIRKEKCLF